MNATAQRHSHNRIICCASNAIVVERTGSLAPEFQNNTRNNYQCIIIISLLIWLLSSSVFTTNPVCPVGVSARGGGLCNYIVTVTTNPGLS